MMSQDFGINLKKLPEGPSTVSYILDGNFFSEREESPIMDCDLMAKVEMLLKEDLLVASINISGSIASSCDRCLANIDLPVSHTEEWYFRKQQGMMDDGDEEIIWLEADQTVLDLGEYLYEASVLSVPAVKVFDCREDEPYPCDEEVLDKLENQSIEPNREARNEENDIWGELKNIDLKES